MKPIAYYITAHGYGHGTRSCDVLNSLSRRCPSQPVIVTTDLPLDFLRNRLANSPQITIRPGAFDVGLIQKDSIQSDLSQTLERLGALYSREQDWIDQERRFMEQNQVAVVVADIPAIPLAAAQRSGIPTIAVGNFSWDWIYEAYASEQPEWHFFIEKFRSVYQRTDCLLRLPFAPPMEQFPVRKDIPLLATAGTACRDKIKANYPQIDENKCWILLSFTSLDLNQQALDTLRKQGDRYEFLCVQPMSFPGSCIHSIDRNHVGFSDILASCDMVVSKPGFGLVSECIVNRKPLIYADRGNFAEYPYLVDGISRYLRNAYLPSHQLYTGDWIYSLEAIQSAPEPTETLMAGGADIIAQEILQRVELIHS